MSATAGRIVVMGVSGSGKSTVAALLAQRLGVPFAEGDEFHSPASRAKMASAVPLTDQDRAPWLASLRDWAAAQPAGCVVSCSALRRSYRDVLRAAGPDVVFLQIDVPAETLRARMDAREGHYMPTALLISQLATLEPLGDDEAGRRLDGSADVDDVVGAALDAVAAPDVVAATALG
ncbi:gluconokinase [Xylanimonas ulmi]|uniref:Gluconokinase n=1 Tax=Xylanimonas ulmi TaxID=228973 RepID=A0A4Q7M4J7_9MICO|nr:gluconokinase [Xylanibacterium ulmi]RZS62514.1 gluconate kinase (SKI family) [Xylanibacterium ulmi]